MLLARDPRQRASTCAASSASSADRRRARGHVRTAISHHRVASMQPTYQKSASVRAAGRRTSGSGRWRPVARQRVQAGACGRRRAAGRRPGHAEGADRGVPPENRLVAAARGAGTGVLRRAPWRPWFDASSAIARCRHSSTRAASPTEKMGRSVRFMPGKCSSMFPTRSLRPDCPEWRLLGGQPRSARDAPTCCARA